MDKIKQSFLQVNIEKTLQIESSAIFSLINSIDYGITTELAVKICECKGKIITTGCGTSGAAARKIAHTFSCIKRPAFFIFPSEALHGGLGVVSPDDIVILISKGGKTQELDIMMKQLKDIGVYTVVVAENNSSPLAMAADLCVEIPVLQEPDSFNMLATASTLATIAYFDALTIAVKEWSRFSKKDFLLVHPAGAVGNRLLNEVLMK